MMLDLVILSRWQFALSIAFHFLFAPLSIGLILMICVLEYFHLKKSDDGYRKLADYFGNIFIVNYAIGIVTGIGMSLQFGTNWSRYSNFMGDVFGAPLALEALLAFFLESTFTGVYIFKRSKMSPKFRLVVTSLIALGTLMSSIWIITANGFMQNPVGYEIAEDGSKVILTSIRELVLNPYAWYMLVHTVTAAYLLSSMFVISVSAYKLLRKDTPEEEKELFAKTTKIAAVVLLIFSISMPAIGYSYMNFIAPLQPAKIAALSGETSTDITEAESFAGEEASYVPVPDNLVPVVNVAYVVMISLGNIFILLSLYTLIFYKKYLKSPTLQKIYTVTWILPYIAIIAGWMVTEIGRQPWVVYGLLKTVDGVSTVPLEQVWFSIITIILINILLYVAVIYLTITQIKKSILEMKYSYVKSS